MLSDVTVCPASIRHPSVHCQQTSPAWDSGDSKSGALTERSAHLQTFTTADPLSTSEPQDDENNASPSEGIVPCMPLADINRLARFDSVSECVWWR